MAFKKKAQFLGAKYISGELESFNFKQQTEIVMQSVPEGEYEGIREANVSYISPYVLRIHLCRSIASLLSD